jgi:hypothetical protein
MIKATFCFVKKSGTSGKTFRRRHGAFVDMLNVVSHSIPHAFPCASGYDGVVDFWFDNALKMYALFVDPTYLAKVRPDEKRFLDLAKCDFIISRELPPLIGSAH